MSMHNGGGNNVKRGSGFGANAAASQSSLTITVEEDTTFLKRINRKFGGAPEVVYKAIQSNKAKHVWHAIKGVFSQKKDHSVSPHALHSDAKFKPPGLN